MLIPVLFFFSALNIHAQYISRSQPVSNNCPTVCPGSVLDLEVFQVQNLNVGDTVQVWLSNASGTFTSGTTTLNTTAYSLNTGTNWTQGPYLFSSNVNNLYIEITIPANLPPGNNYTIYMKTSAGFVATDLFQCSGSNYITVIAAYPTLPVLPANTEGAGYWDASVYTWTPTTSAMLTTTALVAAQDFFDPANYQGYFIKDSLSFDINYTAFGGSCPGVPGVLNDGTDIPCSQGFQTNFAIMMKRRQVFAPGLYTLTVQGDDGIRLSIDGGNTWITGSYFEQLFDTSFRTTATAYPNGVCLSGPVDLVIEYFQYPAQAQLAFTCTALAAVTLPPATQTVCAGANAAFNITGPNTATYQWLYSTDNGITFIPVPNSAPFSGTNTNDLTITNTPAGYNGYLFECQIGGLCGNLDTAAADTLIVGGGAITAQPVNVSVCAGSPASFTIGASGGNYQWQVNTGGGFVNVTNSVPYSGATSATLNISATTPGMNGYQYQCIVTGCGGNTITSNSAALNTGASASITTQPDDTSVCPGNEAVFSITAQNGSSYQWQVNTGSGFVNVTNSAPYSGASGAALNISATTPGMNGYQYQCIVTGCGGNPVTSNAATLNVGSTAAITIQPADTTVCAGNDAAFSIVAQNASSYQWQVNTGLGFSNVTNTPPYSGANAGTLSIVPVDNSMHGYLYQCIITGCGGGTITSSVVVLTIGSGASIVNQPQNVSACPGGNASFTIGAQSAASYQWQVNTGGGFVNIANAAPYSGVTTSVLSVSPVASSMSGYQYQCIVTGCGGADVTSGTATLSLGLAADIINQPVDTAICAGSNAGFAIVAQNAASYQWQVNTGTGYVNINNGSPYSGANDSALVITAPQASMSGYQYQCIITGCSGVAVTSNQATLAVNTSAAFVNQPVDTTICLGGDAGFSISTTAVTGYQWQVNTGSGFVNITDGATYTNTHGQALQINNPAVSMNGYQYRCVIPGCGGADINSSVAALYVNGPPVITSQPADVNVCQEASVSFTVTSSGPGQIYQWQVSTDGGSTYTNLTNASPYQNVQTSTLSIINPTQALDNNFYRCVVTACNQPVNSLGANMTVCPPAVNLFIPNTFTPNGDGANDFFQIYYSDNNLIYLDIKIFNRWGEKVFESNNQHFQWDGTYKSVKQETGVYTYTVTILLQDNQNAIHKKGAITLLR